MSQAEIVQSGEPADGVEDIPTHPALPRVGAHRGVQFSFETAGPQPLYSKSP